MAINLSGELIVGELSRQPNNPQTEYSNIESDLPRPEMRGSVSI
jgi:hypothetical protein